MNQNVFMGHSTRSYLKNVFWPNEFMAETAKTQSQSKAPCGALETNHGQGNVNRQPAKYKNCELFFPKLGKKFHFVGELKRQSTVITTNIKKIA